MINIRQKELTNIMRKVKQAKVNLLFLKWQKINVFVYFAV